MTVTPIADADVPVVIALWQRCNLARPWNDSAADIALARRDENSDILVGRDGDDIVASVLVGHDGHRGWVYYLAVTGSERGTGLGRRLMQAAEAWLVERGAVKLQLMVRESNTAVTGFYDRLGYTDADVRVLAKRLD